MNTLSPAIKGYIEKGLKVSAQYLSEILQQVPVGTILYPTYGSQCDSIYNVPMADRTIGI